MEYFHLKENITFDGILKNAYNNQYLLYPEANGKITNSPAIEVITNTSECVFWVDKVSGSTYIEFGFKRKKVLVTGYQFSTTPDGSPPYEWTLTGSNSKHGKFNIIDSPPETNDTCSYKIGTSQCNERVMNSFYINKGTIPYTYIRFNVIRNRYAIYHNKPVSDIRIGGFELYGVVYSNSALIHTKCRERISNAFLFMIIIIRESK